MLDRGWWLRPLVLAALALFAPSPPAIGQEPDPKPAEPRSAASVLGPGWRWELAPRTLQDSWHQRGFSTLVTSGALSLFTSEAGFVVAHHVRVTNLEASGSRLPEHRVVLLDADGKAVVLGKSHSMGNRTASMQVSMKRPPVEVASAKEVGLAILDFNGRREAAAAATKEAEEAGAQVLPLPVLDEPFPFELPGLDGKTLRSADFAGKVVLIDCWAIT